MMPDMLRLERAILDAQQGDVAGIDAVGAGGDAVSIARKVLLMIAIMLAALGAVRIPFSLSMNWLSSTVRLAPSARMPAPLWLGARADMNVMPRMVMSFPLVTKIPLPSQTLPARTIRPGAFDDKPVRFQPRAIGIGAWEYLDDIAGPGGADCFAGQSVGFSVSHGQIGGSCGENSSGHQQNRQPQSTRGLQWHFHRGSSAFRFWESRGAI